MSSSRRIREDKQARDDKLTTECKCTFNFADRDQDGYISEKDLKESMKLLGHDVTDQDIKKFLKDFGDIGFKGLRETDFLKWMKKQSETNQSDPLQEAFEVFDRDNDGFISREDLRQGLNMAGQKVPEVTLNLMIQIADRDQDGRLNFKEFCDAMKTFAQ